MAKDTPVKRPLVSTGVHTEFGEVIDDPSAPHLGGRKADVTYTPGFSEARYQRDIEVAEFQRGLRKREDVHPLAGNVRLVRRSSVGGTPDFIKQTQSANAGYKPLTDDQIGPGKLVTAVPKGATRLPDGTYAKGDTLYMYCDAPTAARNAYEKQQRTQARLLAAQDKAEQSGVDYDSRLMEPLAGHPTSRVQVR